MIQISIIKRNYSQHEHMLEHLQQYVSFGSNGLLFSIVELEVVKIDFSVENLSLIDFN